LTLTELGNLLSVHNTFVSQLEKGRKVPNAEMILRVADTFGVTTDQLMRDDLDLLVYRLVNVLTGLVNPPLRSSLLGFY